MRTVFAHPNRTEIAAAWDRTADMFARQFPKVKTLMDDAKTDVMMFRGNASRMDAALRYTATTGSVNAGLTCSIERTGRCRPPYDDVARVILRANLEKITKHRSGKGPQTPPRHGIVAACRR